MNKKFLQRVTGYGSYSHYVCFLYHQNDFLTYHTCKETVLYAIRMRTREDTKEIFFKCSIKVIEKVLSFWEENKLPKFDYEIVNNEKLCGLYLKYQDPFLSLIYLDTLITLLKSEHKRGKNKPLLEKVSNSGSWKDLRTATSLIINNPNKDLSPINLMKQFYPKPGVLWGVAKSYRAGHLQEIIENA